MQEQPQLRDTAGKSSARETQSREVSLAVRNGLRLGISLVLTWSVAMIVKLQIPSFLGPVRQGHLGFAESFAGVFLTCLGLGIDTYIMKEVSVRPKHASDLVGGIFVLRALMSAVLLPAMVATLWITGRSPEILLTATVFGIANLVLTTNGTLTAVLQATGHAAPVALANVTTKVMWGAGLLAALHYNASLPVLALALPAAELLKTAILVFASRGMRLGYRIDVRAVRGALIASVPYFVNSVALGVLSNLGMSVLEFIRKDEREVGWFAAIKNIEGLCALLMPLIAWVIMPLLSRAYARSEAEGLSILRRCLEGFIIVIMPITVLTSAGSDILVHLAFGEKYAPAAVGLSILSLVFVMTYLDTLCAIALTISGKGWSVTVISVGSVFVTAALMFVFVPIGPRVLSVGGECAGAATAVILTEVCVLIAMLSRFTDSAIDKRGARALVKSLAVGIVVLFVDRRLRGIGALRLVVDAALYTAMALAMRIVRITELRSMLRVLRRRPVETSALG